MGIKIGNTDISKIKIASGLTPRLPSAYQEVEWIQSSGTQYINTGYNPLTTTEFEIEYEPVRNNQTYMCIFGTRKDYNLNAYYIGYTSSRSYYGFGNNHVDPSSVGLGGIGIRRAITYHNNTLSNGTETTTVVVNSAPYGSMAIFGDESNGVVGEKNSMKLYSFKLYESSTLVRDFVPCYRKADGVIGMYDLVNDQFYTNSGTGTFAKGEDVNLPYKEIRKVYKGSTQVRPSRGGGWQPGANTLLYFPLKNNAVDTVNNVTLTSYGTTNYTAVGGVQSAEFTKSNWLYNTSVSYVPQGDVAKTISIWLCIKGGNNNWAGVATIGKDTTGQTFGFADPPNTMNLCMTRCMSTSNTYTLTANQWTNAVMTYKNSTWTMYINGTAQVTWSTTAPTSGNNVQIGNSVEVFDPNCAFYGNISDFILEDKCRSAQEVLDYFDQTKGDYGIS